ncbi:hypothetical protein YYG_04722 [Plasmodium vinckei petteri]|uniref:Uncharacterized protein n=1 Tax=Plasmodium vinckei petteri TaxID=138298 RepID=W7AMZ6_PLAVN|nr:hypothetical protein YYG_04722 [Plasmodium vinckei petteri]CAD2095164.1 conserved Plasmodium protein, unknown function [Plasmodium vinckei petteri]
METNGTEDEVKNSEVIWESLYNDFEEITDTNKKHFNYIENSLYNFCKGVHSSSKSNYNLKNRTPDTYENNNSNTKNNENNKLELENYNVNNPEENNNQLANLSNDNKLAITQNNGSDFGDLKKKYNNSYGKIYNNENDYLKNNYVDNDSDYLKAETHISYNDVINSDKTRNSDNLNTSLSHLSSELKKKAHTLNDMNNARKNHSLNNSTRNVVSFMSECGNTKKNINIDEMRKDFFRKREEDYSYLLSNKKIYDDAKSCGSEILYSSRFSAFDNYKKNNILNKLKNNKNFDVKTEYNLNLNNSASSEKNVSLTDIRNIAKNMNINISNLNSLEKLDMLLKKKNNNLSSNYSTGNPDLSFFLNHEKNNDRSRKALSQCANNDYKMYSHMLEKLSMHSGKYGKNENSKLATIEDADHEALINRSKKLLEISKKCLSENKNDEKKYNTNTFSDLNSKNINKKSQNFILSKLIRNCHSTGAPSVAAISTVSEKINPNHTIKNIEYELNDSKNEIGSVKHGSIHGGGHTYEYSGKDYINFKKGKNIISSASQIDALSQVDDKEKEKNEKEYNKCLYHLFEAYDKEKLTDVNGADNNDKNDDSKIHITNNNESFISSLKGHNKTNIENAYDLKSYEFNLDYQDSDDDLKQSSEKKISDEIKMLKNKLIEGRIGIIDDNNSVCSKKNISSSNSMIHLYEHNKDSGLYSEKLKKGIIECGDLEHISDEFFNKNYNGNDIKLLFKENMFLQELCEKRKVLIQKYKNEKAKLCVEMKSLLSFNNNLNCALKEKEAEINILKKEKEELETNLMKQLANNTNNKFEFLKNFQSQHSTSKQEKGASFNTCSSNGYNMLCDKNGVQSRYTNDNNNSSVIKSYEDKIQELLIQIKMYQKKNSDLQEQLKIFMNE